MANRDGDREGFGRSRRREDDRDGGEARGRFYAHRGYRDRYGGGSVRETDYDRGYDTEGYYGPDYSRETDYGRGTYQSFSQRGSTYGRRDRQFDERYGPARTFRSGQGSGYREWYGPGGDYGYERYGDAEWDYMPDWYTNTGPYTGMGPQQYARSDDFIFDDVCQRLTEHGQIDARDIEVDVKDGEVTLQGTVDSRRSKRMAEDVAESAMGVLDVHNRLRIKNK